MAHRSTRTHLEAVLLARRPDGDQHRKTRANGRPARPKPSPPPGEVLVVPARRSQPPRWAWVVIATIAAAMIIVVVVHTATAAISTGGRPGPGAPASSGPR
jgi:hypothetical protein